MAARTRRSVGWPTAAVIRRTCRLRPSRSLISSHVVGMVAGLQRAVVGQEDEALAVVVEPAGGVDAGHGHVVGERPSPGPVRELAEHGVGLVEEDQHGGLGGVYSIRAICRGSTSSQTRSLTSNTSWGRAVTRSRRPLSAGLTV